jgi:hypothetical protein
MAEASRNLARLARDDEAKLGHSELTFACIPSDIHDGRGEATSLNRTLGC